MSILLFFILVYFYYSTVGLLLRKNYSSVIFIKLNKEVKLNKYK